MHCRDIKLFKIQTVLLLSRYLSPGLDKPSTRHNYHLYLINWPVNKCQKYSNAYHDYWEEIQSLLPQNSFSSTWHIISNTRHICQVIQNSTNAYHILWANGSLLWLYFRLGLFESLAWHITFSLCTYLPSNFKINPKSRRHEKYLPPTLTWWILSLVCDTLSQVIHTPAK